MCQLTDDLSCFGAQFDQMAENARNVSEYPKQHQLSQFFETLRRKKMHIPGMFFEQDAPGSYGIKFDEVFL